jgi:hypothetical protein
VSASVILVLGTPGEYATVISAATRVIAYIGGFPNLDVRLCIRDRTKSTSHSSKVTDITDYKP